MDRHYIHVYTLYIQQYMEVTMGTVGHTRKSPATLDLQTSVHSVETAVQGLSFFATAHIIVPTHLWELPVLIF